MTTFNKIHILTKPQVDDVTQMVTYIIKDYAITNHIPLVEDLADIKDENEKVLFVSVGGDGTMLGAMRSSIDYENSTILGLNTGTLGFLADEVPTQLWSLLDDILNEKDVLLEERMMLTGQCLVNGKSFGKSANAINEFTLVGASTNSPVVTEVHINEHFASRQMGSGVLVSTSTGSTAMSLSAGGAIVSPSTNVMQVVPLMPHTLTSRPIISSGRDEITISATLTDRLREINITADGQSLFHFSDSEGTKIDFVIKSHPTPVKIWRAKNWNFFNVLSEKMKW